MSLSHSCPHCTVFSHPRWFKSFFKREHVTFQIQPLQLSGWRPSSRRASKAQMDCCHLAVQKRRHTANGARGVLNLCRQSAFQVRLVVLEYVDMAEFIAMRFWRSRTSAPWKHLGEYPSTAPTIWQSLEENWDILDIFESKWMKFD